MIRPLTIATCLLACGSGLYLYQSKHEVQLLDRTIERTVHETSALREQSRLLAAEWTMLNDPERLRHFSNTYLNLKTITPSQFTSLADLDNRLPAPRAEQPSRGTDAPQLLAVAPEAGPASPPDALAPDATAAAAESADPAVADQESLPVPPLPSAPPAPMAAPLVASVAHPTDPRPAETRTADHVAAPRPAPDNQPRSVATLETRSPESRTFETRPDQRADQRAVDQRAADQHLVEKRPTPRVAATRSDPRAAAPPRSILPGAPRPSPTAASINPVPAPVPAPSRPATVATSAPVSGSLLGMAHGSMPPAPRPTPVNAAYNSN